MGTGKKARERRVVYQWTFTRQKHDDKTINARFVRVTGGDKTLDQATIERARQLAGLKGYVTNIKPETMAGDRVIAACHDLWHVEASFRMATSDLRARPVFHYQSESIEAHLTVVFAALAITRDLTRRSGVSVKKIVQTLRTVRSATIQVGGQTLTLDPQVPHHAQTILDALKTGH